VQSVVALANGFNIVEENTKKHTSLEDKTTFRIGLVNCPPALAKPKIERKDKLQP
jgi:hypothetical protein